MVVTAFLGVIVMNISKTESSVIDTSQNLEWLGITLCTIVTFCHVFVSICIKKMNEHVHYMIQAAYFAYACLLVIIAVIILFPSWMNFSHYTFTDMLLFSLSGVVHYTGQTLTSMSYKNTDASKVTPFSYFSSIYLLIFDIFVFKYSFTFTDIIGITIVVLSLVLGYKFAQKKEKK